MIHPSFTPELPPGWSYVITRVTSIAHGHLVIYVTTCDTFKEHRVAFVDAEGFAKWDCITWVEWMGEPIKIERVRLPPEKIKRVRL